MRSSLLIRRLDRALGRVIEITIMMSSQTNVTNSANVPKIVIEDCSDDEVLNVTEGVLEILCDNIPEIKEAYEQDLQMQDPEEFGVKFTVVEKKKDKKKKKKMQSAGLVETDVPNFQYTATPLEVVPFPNCRKVMVQDYKCYTPNLKVAVKETFTTKMHAFRPMESHYRAERKSLLTKTEKKNGNCFLANGRNDDEFKVPANCQIIAGTLSRAIEDIDFELDSVRKYVKTTKKCFNSIDFDEYVFISFFKDVVRHDGDISHNIFDDGDEQELCPLRMDPTIDQGTFCPEHGLWCELHRLAIPYDRYHTIWPVVNVVKDLNRMAFGLRSRNTLREGVQLKYEDLAFQQGAPPSSRDLTGEYILGGDNHTFIYVPRDMIDYSSMTVIQSLFFEYCRHSLEYQKWLLITTPIEHSIKFVHLWMEFFVNNRSKVLGSLQLPLDASYLARYKLYTYILQNTWYLPMICPNWDSGEWKSFKRLFPHEVFTDLAPALMHKVFVDQMDMNITPMQLNLKYDLHDWSVVQALGRLHFRKFRQGDKELLVTLSGVKHAKTAKAWLDSLTTFPVVSVNPNVIRKKLIEELPAMIPEYKYSQRTVSNRECISALLSLPCAKPVTKKDHVKEALNTSTTRVKLAFISEMVDRNSYYCTRDVIEKAKHRAPENMEGVKTLQTSYCIFLNTFLFYIRRYGSAKKAFYCAVNYFCENKEGWAVKEEWRTLNIHLWPLLLEVFGGSVLENKTLYQADDYITLCLKSESVMEIDDREKLQQILQDMYYKESGLNTPVLSGYVTWLKRNSLQFAAMVHRLKREIGFRTYFMRAAGFHDNLGVYDWEFNLHYILARICQANAVIFDRPDEFPPLHNSFKAAPECERSKAFLLQYICDCDHVAEDCKCDEVVKYFMFCPTCDSWCDKCTLNSLKNIRKNIVAVEKLIGYSITFQIDRLINIQSRVIHEIRTSAEARKFREEASEVMNAHGVTDTGELEKFMNANNEVFESLADIAKDVSDKKIVGKVSTALESFQKLDVAKMNSMLDLLQPKKDKDEEGGMMAMLGSFLTSLLPTEELEKWPGLYSMVTQILTRPKKILNCLIYYGIYKNTSNKILKYFCICSIFRNLGILDGILKCFGSIRDTVLDVLEEEEKKKKDKQKEEDSDTEQKEALKGMWTPKKIKLNGPDKTQFDVSMNEFKSADDDETLKLIRESRPKENSSIYEWIIWLWESIVTHKALSALVLVGVLNIVYIAKNASQGSKPEKTKVEGFRNAMFMFGGLNNGFAFVKNFFGCLKNAFNWVAETTGLKKPFDDDKKKDEFIKDVKLYCAQIHFYNTSKGKALAMYNPVHRHLLMKLVAAYPKMRGDGLGLQNVQASNSYLAQLERTIRSLEVHLQFIASMKIRRMTPYHVQLTGRPGIGKSHLIGRLIDMFSTTIFKDFDPNKLCYAMSPNEFQEGYCGQPIIVTDEANMLKDPLPFLQTILIHSSTTHYMNVANMDEKKTPMTSIIHISATNTPYPSNDGLYEIIALFRRRNILVLLEVEDKYMVEGNVNKKLVDSDLGEGAFEQFKHVKFIIKDPMTDKIHKSFPTPLNFEQFTCVLLSDTMSHLFRERQTCASYSYQKEQASLVAKAYNALESVKNKDADTHRLLSIIRRVDESAINCTMADSLLCGNVDFEALSDALEGNLKESIVKCKTDVINDKLEEFLEQDLRGSQLHKLWFDKSVNFKTRSHAFISSMSKFLTFTHADMQLFMKDAEHAKTKMAAMSPSECAAFVNTAYGILRNCKIDHSHIAHDCGGQPAFIVPCLQAAQSHKRGVPHECKSGCVLYGDKILDIIPSEAGPIYSIKGMDLDDMKDTFDYDKFLENNFKCGDMEKHEKDGTNYYLKVPSSASICKEHTNLVVNFEDDEWYSHEVTKDGHSQTINLSSKFIQQCEIHKGKIRCNLGPTPSSVLADPAFHYSYGVFIEYSFNQQKRIISIENDKYKLSQDIASILSKKSRSTYYEFMAKLGGWLTSPISYMLDHYPKLVKFLLSGALIIAIIAAGKAIGSWFNGSEYKYAAVNRTRYPYQPKAVQMPTESANITQFRNSCFNNTETVVIKGMHMHMIGIKERMAIIPLHGIKKSNWGQDGLDIEFPGSDKSWVAFIPKTNIVLMPQCDAALILLPNRHRAFKDISNCFVRKEKLSNFVPGPMSVPFQTRGGEFMYDKYVKAMPITRFPSGTKLNIPIYKVAVVDGYYEAGKSGSLLISDEPRLDHRIYGILSNGNEQNSSFAIITHEDLNDAMSLMLDQSDGVFHQNQPLAYDSEVEPKFGHLFDNQEMVLGSVPPEFRSYSPGKTTLVKSYIADHFEESERTPAKIHMRNKAEHMRHSLNKSERDKMVTIPQKFLDYATQEVASIMKSAVPKGEEPFKRQLLDFEECILGCDGLKRFNNKTSAGLPRCLDKDARGKQKWIQYDEEGYYWVADDLYDEFWQWDETVRQGDVPPFSTLVFPKDELRPIEKSEKTRTIDSFPCVHGLICRRYFGVVEAFMHKLPVGDYMSQVGIYPEGKDGDDLVKSMFKVGSVGIDIDFSNWDGHMTIQLFLAFLRWVELVTGNTDPVIRRARYVLVMSIACANCQFADVVFQTFRGMKSGSMLTTTCNTVSGCILSVAMFTMWAWAKDLVYYIPRDVRTKHLWIGIYGDDNLLVVSDEMSKIMDPEEFRQVYAAFGWPTTTAGKSTDKLAWKDISDLVFLKRMMYFDQRFERFSWKIDVQVILDLIRFMRLSTTQVEQFQSNVKDSLRFAYHHGRFFYKRFSAKIRLACRDEKVPIDMVSFSDMVILKVRECCDDEFGPSLDQFTFDIEDDGLSDSD